MRPEFVLFLFTLSANAYEEQSARDAMAYASAAYCSFSRVATWAMNSDCAAQTNQFTPSKAFKSTPSNVKVTREYFGFIGVDTEREWVVASFKGTNGSMADFLTDLSGGYMNDDCKIDGVVLGKVHSGFCEYFKYLNKDGFGNELVAVADAYPSYRVVVTGHSLGAAAAVVGAAYLAQKHPDRFGDNRMSVITYGLPRVGDSDFSKAFKKHVGTNAWRVVHAKDAIAHQPPCCALVGECKKATSCPYHIESEVLYDNDMSVGSSFTLCEGPEDRSCNNWVDLSVDDHLHYFDVEIGNFCCYETSS